MNFFKDGKDLGPAFIDKRLKTHALYPFVQVQSQCELHIFHPASHPQYRPPLAEDSIARWEEEERRKRAEEQVQEEKRRRRIRRRLLGLDPDENSDDELFKEILKDEADPSNKERRKEREKKEIALIKKRIARERKLAAMPPEKREALERAKARK